MVFVASSVKVSRDVKQFCESSVFGSPVIGKKKRKHWIWSTAGSYFSARAQRLDVGISAYFPQPEWP